MDKINVTTEFRGLSKSRQYKCGSKTTHLTFVFVFVFVFVMMAILGSVSSNVNVSHIWNRVALNVV